ncbi:hypothetical protein MMC29_003090 [Sticta canariensis]|nr:hypothetical protein [Sticta canariensis]
MTVEASNVRDKNNDTTFYVCPALLAGVPRYITCPGPYYDNLPTTSKDNGVLAVFIQSQYAGGSGFGAGKSEKRRRRSECKRRKRSKGKRAQMGWNLSIGPARESTIETVAEARRLKWMFGRKVRWRSGEKVRLGGEGPTEASTVANFIVPLDSIKHTWFPLHWRPYAPCTCQQLDHEQRNRDDERREQQRQERQRPERQKRLDEQ